MKCIEDSRRFFKFTKLFKRIFMEGGDIWQTRHMVWVVHVFVLT